MQRKGMSRVEMQTLMGTLFVPKNGRRRTGNHTYPSSPRLSVSHFEKLSVLASFLVFYFLAV